MQDHENSNWRETYFTADQWACVPANRRMWCHPDTALEADERLATAHEIGLVIHAIMVTALTERQRAVMDLYYLECCTQVEIATELGISQPTVSQHLRGKRRGTNTVGGAFRKIRKAIHKTAALRAGEDTRFVEIVAALDALLDSSITRRRARAIIGALTHHATHRP